MKNYLKSGLYLLLFLLSSLYGSAQRSLKAPKDHAEATIDAFVAANDEAGLYTYLKKTPFILADPKTGQFSIISRKAFTKMLKTDFGKFILGTDNASKIGKYATLDLSDKPAFDFAPFVIESQPGKIYSDIGSVSFSGKLNGDQYLNIKDIRDVGVKFNWTHIWRSASKYDYNNHIPVSQPDYRGTILNSIEKIHQDYLQDLALYSMNPFADATADATAKKHLLKKYMESFYDAEIEKSDAYWSRKRFFWHTVSFGFKRDKVDFVNADSLVKNVFSPVSSTIFIPEVNVSLNYFIKTANAASLFVTVWGCGKIKHSLSEIYEPEKFQSYKKMNDSLFQQKDLSSVFITNFSKVDKKAVFDFGIRTVLMGNIKKQNLGVSFSFNRKGLVNDRKYASLFRTEAGVVIPFTKADGETKFNIEVFHRWDVYSKFDNSNGKNFGVRFNIPLSSR